MGLNRTSYRRRTGIYPETFHDMHEVLQAWEGQKKKPGRPAALSMAEQLILTLEFWREYRTYFHLARIGGCMKPPRTQGNRKVGTDHSFSWRMKGFNSIQLRCMPMNGVDSPPRHSDD